MDLIVIVISVCLIMAMLICFYYRSELDDAKETQRDMMSELTLLRHQLEKYTIAIDIDVDQPVSETFMIRYEEPATLVSYQPCRACRAGKMIVRVSSSGEWSQMGVCAECGEVAEVAKDEEPPEGLNLADCPCPNCNGAIVIDQYANGMQSQREHCYHCGEVFQFP